MKKLIILASLLLAGTSQARSVQELCSYIASSSTSSGVECIQAIAVNAIFDPKAVDFCFVIAQSSTSSAVSCVKSIGGRSFQADATDVCSYIASSSTSSGLACLSSISNKVFLNGTAGLCKQIAQSSTSSALSCLASAGQPIGENLCPSPREVQSSVSRALNAIYSGSPSVAVNYLQNLQERLAPCVR